MKIHTRMVITFLAVALVPLVMMVIVFCLLRMSLDASRNESFRFGGNMEEIVIKVDELYSGICARIDEDPSCLDDSEYLQDMSSELSALSSTLIIRKGGELYYTGNSRMSDGVWGRLPEYGTAQTGSETGIYFGDLEEYVRQYDFVFADGSKGTLFVLVNANAVMNRKLTVDMFVSMILILLITALLVTFWNKKGMLDPMSELSRGLTQVREGNFDYVIEHTGERGEVGELFRNYEDMRMRLRENEERTAEQEKKNRELISNISHDLKTPITSIKGYVEGILDGVASTPEKQEKYLRTIYNKAVDMDKLLNELTLYSSVENDRIKYNFLKLNVTDYFKDCIEEVGLDMETRGIAFNYVNTLPSKTRIIADPEQLRKVINNIIGNSIKYMDKPSKTISMRVLDGGDDIIVEIEDNGKGIAVNDIPRIFERFYRSDSARNTAQGGSGIGLSIVKKIIEDHGGHIWATSKLNEGTCMHFVIRKYKEDVYG